jgi:hypothetical protein
MCTPCSCSQQSETKILLFDFFFYGVANEPATWGQREIHVVKWGIHMETSVKLPVINEKSFDKKQYILLEYLLFSVKDILFHTLLPGIYDIEHPCDKHERRA